jgi:hypothetical protein
MRTTDARAVPIQANTDLVRFSRTGPRRMGSPLFSFTTTPPPHTHTCGAAAAGLTRAPEAAHSCAAGWAAGGHGSGGWGAGAARVWMGRGCPANGSQLLG